MGKFRPFCSVSLAIGRDAAGAGNGVRIMATKLERERLRKDIGADENSLTNTDADEIFTEAGEEYTAAGQIKAAARVIAIQRLLASSAKMASYKQNQSSENLSDIFGHLESLLAYWDGQISKATSSGQSSANFGRTRVIPRRIVEFPDA
jgi:hypothetical protein